MFTGFKKVDYSRENDRWIYRRKFLTWRGNNQAELFVDSSSWRGSLSSFIWNKIQQMSQHTIIEEKKYNDLSCRSMV